MSAFEGKTAIVTGGSSGIGLSAARRLAAGGAKVLITGRDRTRLDQATAGETNIEIIVADVSRTGDAKRTVDAVLQRWGKIDILINNAGAGALLPLGGATEQIVSDILAVNVIGPSMLAKEALPYLAITRGTIINVSSTFGHKAGREISHYASSKAALEHLTRCWALELAAKGIRVNAVAAGPTETGALTGMMGLSAKEAAAVADAERLRIPLGRRGRAEDVARWIVNLAEPSSDWITGQIIAVDGGLGLA